MYSHLPAPPPTYCDARLATLNMSMWTTVPIPNDLAAAAISLYLQTDHPLLGFFDADIFLEDLVEGRSRYCSPLLVSSLLFWALVSHLLRLTGRRINVHGSMGLSLLTSGLEACRVVSVPNVSASGTHGKILTHYQRCQRHYFLISAGRPMETSDCPTTSFARAYKLPTSLTCLVRLQRYRKTWIAMSSCTSGRPQVPPGECSTS